MIKMFTNPWFAAVFYGDGIIVFGQAPPDNGYGTYIKVKEKLEIKFPGLSKQMKVFISETPLGYKVTEFAEKKAKVNRGTFSKFKTKRMDLR